MTAFANSADFELFYERWCDRCTGDEEMRETGFGGCEILCNAMLGEPTPQLLKWDRQVICTDFIHVDTATPPAPIEVSPDQLTLDGGAP